VGSIVHSNLAVDMTQPNLLELAKKGNAKAITALMNRKLQAKNITAKAEIKQACLHVILESQQVPNREASIAFIRQGMLNLKPESIQKVKVYGQKIGEDSSSWSEEFELITKPSLATLKQQAKQGDIEAITALLNRALEYKNITTQVTLKNDCLQVILESSSLPNQQTVTILIRRELLTLKVNSLKTVKIYGRKRGEEFIAWNSEFELVDKVTPNLQNSLVASFNNSESDSLTKKATTASTVKTTNFDFRQQIKQAWFLFTSNIGFFCSIIFRVKFLPYLLFFVFEKAFSPYLSYFFIKYFIPYFFIKFVIALLCESLAVGAIVFATHQIKQNRQPTYEEAISVGFRKWRLILLCRVLIVFFMSVLLIGLVLLAINLYILLWTFPPVFFFFGVSLLVVIMIMIMLFSCKFVFVDSIVVFEEEKEPSAIIKKSEFLTKGIKLNLFITTFLFSIPWLIVRIFLTFMLKIKFSQPVIELLEILLDSIYSVILEIFFVLCYWKVRIQKSDLYQ
jgi:hypothetical protein